MPPPACSSPAATTSRRDSSLSPESMSPPSIRSSPSGGFSDDGCDAALSPMLGREALAAAVGAPISAAAASPASASSGRFRRATWGGDLVQPPRAVTSPRSASSTPPRTPTATAPAKAAPPRTPPDGVVAVPPPPPPAGLECVPRRQCHSKRRDVGAPPGVSRDRVTRHVQLHSPSLSRLPPRQRRGGPAFAACFVALWRRGATASELPVPRFLPCGATGAGCGSLPPHRPLAVHVAAARCSRNGHST
jgi:hypothetical protein